MSGSSRTLIKPGEPDFYASAKFERRAHGAILADGKEVGHTLQCPHCGGHFVSRTGSGARRTFCTPCSAVTCGNPACDACLPHEKRMELIESFARHLMKG